MKIQWDHERIRRLVVRALADGRYGGLWEIALLAGMSPSFLSRIMQGERGMRLWKAERLAAVLGVEVRDLMLSNGHSSTSAVRFPLSTSLPCEVAPGRLAARTGRAAVDRVEPLPGGRLRLVLDEGDTGSCRGGGESAVPPGHLTAQYCHQYCHRTAYASGVSGFKGTSAFAM